MELAAKVPADVVKLRLVPLAGNGTRAAETSASLRNNLVAPASSSLLENVWAVKLMPLEAGARLLKRLAGLRDTSCGVPGTGCRIAGKMSRLGSAAAA